MRTFMVINGSNAYVIEKESFELALQSTENLTNHSEEIILREIKTLTTFLESRCEIILDKT